MKKKRMMKLVQEGDYVTKVEVELIEDDTGWSLISPSQMPVNWMRFAREQDYDGLRVVNPFV